MQTLFRFITVFKPFLDLWMRATLAPTHCLDGRSLHDRDPQVIEQLLPLLDWLYQDYFCAQTDGWEHIPASGKVLLIGSHNGGLAAPDMHLAMRDWYQKFGSDRLAYGLMHPKVWTVMPGLARLATQMGTLRAHPKMAFAALQQDAALLVYPGGAQDVFRPYSQSNKIYFHGRQGFIKLALRTETTIVPIISYGAHSTLVVLTDIYSQLQRLHQFGLPWLFGVDPEVFPIYLGLPWGIAFGPLPNLPFPIQIHTRICPPIRFERYGSAAAQDADYVEECYDRVQRLMQHELNQLIESVGRPQVSPFIHK